MMHPDEILEPSRADWNRESCSGQSQWCVPVDAETIERARRGDWSVVLTPNIPVPREWFGELRGRDVLCLASGGGQQAPILAAAGGRVTSFDLSDEQLAKDRLVADREGLPMTCIRGNMADLSALADRSFDLIFNPVSNVFAEDVRPVWKECFRVLRPDGVLLAGFLNPAMFLFDHHELKEAGEIKVKYPLPYSDPACPDPAARQRWLESGLAAEFSHSLENQIGGQLAAGFVLTGLYEDKWSDDWSPLNKYLPLFLATRARKPVSGQPSLLHKAALNREATGG